MELAGGETSPGLARRDPLPGEVNSFVGGSAEWRTGIPTYGGVEYVDVYDGIDVRYYGEQRQLEYDFRIAARSDPDQIGLRFEGAKDIVSASEGSW